MGTERDDLRERVQRLEADLALLRVELAGAITTSRLVIVDDAGTERIILSVGPSGAASVSVRVQEPSGNSTGIELYADSIDTLPPNAGLCLYVDGNIVSQWGLG